ncbi:MAG: LPS assembly protein LptD [Silanimonas sp.]
MSRPNLHPLALALGLALALPARAAESLGGDGPNWALCRAPIALESARTRPPTVGAEGRETTPTDIQADTLDVSGEKVTTFSGRVELSRADQWVGTDTLIYVHEDETWQSPGPLRFEDEGVRVAAKSADGDNAAERIRLRDVEYQLIDGTMGNGTADAVIREGQRSTLADALFSTCPPGQRQWAFEAETIEIDDVEKRGVAQNATLRLGNVPVLWLPWISFPTTDERRTGLLAPKIGVQDDNGFDYEQPIYINIAPHMDATLTPRWMSRRGLMLGGEFRYLGQANAGTVEGTYLRDDDRTGEDRGFFRWQHFSALSPHWYATANLQDVSDREYFRDLGDNFGQNTLSLLDSSVALNGRGRFWSTGLSFERWEAANPAVLPGSEPYSRLPRLRGQWLQPVLPWLDLGVNAEAVRFEHDALPGGRRIDLTPRVKLAFGGASWFVNPEFALRYTRYELQRDPRVTVQRQDLSPDRSTPISSLDAGLLFERDTTIFGGDYVQTLEPRLYYLRVPYREQGDLPLFDTQPLSFSWPGLFRQNRYTGADRQADANQATLAVTTRLLDADDGRERLSASLGRIHYFDTPRVVIPGERPAASDGSAYVGELDWRVSDAWSVSVAQQWNPGALGTDLSAVRTQWRFSERGLLNASYRYRKDLIEQTDVSFTAPINAHWRAVGRWAWSLRDRRTQEALGGLEWRSCCVAVRMLARDYVQDLNGERNLGVYLEIELNGIGSFGRDSERLLSDAILGYSP